MSRCTEHSVSRACAVVLLAMTIAAPVRAEEPEPGMTKQAAATLANQAFEMFEAGQYQDSIEMFRLAETRFHAPAHLLFIARAQAKLGLLLAARDTYAILVDEVLDDAAPEPFHQAKREARAEAVELAARIPNVDVTITGVPLASVELSIDGRAVTPGIVELDPGEHVIEAKADHGATDARNVVLDEGVTERVELLIDPPPPPPPAPPAPAPPPPRWMPPPPRPTTSPLVVTGYVSLAVGAAAAIAGAVTGVLSLEQSAEIGKQCQDNHCPEALRADGDRATALGHASTATFVIAGVAVAAGATLWVVGTADDAAAGARLTTDGALLRLDWRF